MRSVSVSEIRKSNNLKKSGGVIVPFLDIVSIPVFIITCNVTCFRIFVSDVIMGILYDKSRELMKLIIGLICFFYIR